MTQTPSATERSQVKNLISANVSVNVVARVLYMVTRVFLPPIILSFIGMDEYGIWATCFIIIGYLGLSAFGISTVYVRYVAEYHARGRTDQINRLLSTGVLTSTVASAAFLVGLWFLMPMVVGLLSIPAGLEDRARIVIFAAAAVFMLDLSLGSFAYVLHGLQRLALQNGVWVVSFLLESVLIVVLLYQGLGLYALLYAFIVRYVLATVADVILCYRCLPGLSLRWSHIDRGMLRLFYGYGGVVQLAAILGTFLYSIEKMLAGAFVGVRSTGLLDIGEKLPVMTTQIFMSMNTAFMPAMSHLGSLDRREEIAKLVLKGARYTHMATGLAMGFLAAFAAPLLRLWLGPRDDMGVLALVSVAMALPYQIHTLTGPATSFHRGAGSPARELYYKLLQLALVMVTVGAGFALFGRTLNVIIAGVAFSMVASCVAYSYYSNRFLQIGAWQFTREVMVPGLVPYVTGGMLAWLSHPWLAAADSSRVELLLPLAVCGAVYTLVTGAVLLYGLCSWGEREYLVRQMLHTLRSAMPGRGRSRV